MTKYRYLKIGIFILLVAFVLHPIPVIVVHYLPVLKDRMDNTFFQMEEAMSKVKELRGQGGSGSVGQIERLSKERNGLFKRHQTILRWYQNSKSVKDYSKVLCKSLIAVAFVFFFAEILTGAIRDPGET